MENIKEIEVIKNFAARYKAEIMDRYENTVYQELFFKVLDEMVESTIVDEFVQPCYMCDNARVNDELEDYNDFSSSTIGSFSRDCRIMLSSGNKKPLRIEIARWNDEVGQWENIGIYYPKFCPECGREIKEYKNNEKTK
jgi:hypothetical protein